MNIGQPISHRLDHMMSGIRSQIAVKLYGRDIEELRDRGQDIAEVMAEIPGVVDLQIEPQVDIPQVRVTIRRQEAARYGLAPADVAKALETALQGRTVSQVLEGQRVFDLVVWFDEQARNNIDAIRSVIALLLVNRPAAEALAEASWWQIPGIWIGATDLSVAHWVGFITLIGIVSRNGIMMISHYIHLMNNEGEVFGEQMIIRGSLERLAPVMMTALTTLVGLVPLAMSVAQTGKEILHPLAIVVIGGLLMSTLLDQIVTPALFFKFGRKVYERPAGEEDPEISGPSAPLHLAEQFE